MPTKSSLSERLAERAEAALRKREVPGISVALVDRSLPLWTASRGVTDRSSPRPVLPSTVFEGASLFKPLIAYGVLDLVREGRFELDRPLDAYLSEPYLPHEPRAAAITARMVLSHTTGYPNWRAAGEPLTLLRPPGSAFGYSGEGYVQLVRTLEQVTGQSLDTFLTDHVLRPLRMDDSSLIWSARHEVARGHSATGEPLPQSTPTDAADPSGFHTTAVDFSRFLEALLDPPETAPLGPDAVDAMTTPQVQLSGPLAWGLGCGLADDRTGPIFWQWGDNHGYKTFAAGSRSAQKAIVVLTNGNNGLAVTRDLVTIVFPALTVAFDAVLDLGRYTLP